MVATLLLVFHFPLDVGEACVVPTKREGAHVAFVLSAHRVTGILACENFTKSRVDLVEVRAGLWLLLPA